MNELFDSIYHISKGTMRSKQRKRDREQEFDSDVVQDVRPLHAQLSRHNDVSQNNYDDFGVMILAMDNKKNQESSSRRKRKKAKNKTNKRAKRRKIMADSHPATSDDNMRPLENDDHHVDTTSTIKSMTPAMDMKVPVIMSTTSHTTTRKRPTTSSPIPETTACGLPSSSLLVHQQPPEQVPPHLSFTFPTEADDHCESPLEAYQDIVPFLMYLCKNQPATSVIYDPYYCDGAVIRNLNSLGFPNVYNKNEDCYQVWKKQSLMLSSSSSSSAILSSVIDPNHIRNTSTYPEFDILVTNPPYSGDHIQRLIEHVTSSHFGTKPWFLLLPNFVHKKDYFIQATTTQKNLCFYVIPHKRYRYVPPHGYRAMKQSNVHKKSSPFISMWYIYGGTSNKTEELIQLFYQNSSSTTTNNDKKKKSSTSTEPFTTRCDLARSRSALRDLRRKQR